MESFSPYSSWLDLNAAPKNFYELLGLALFENDPRAISSAADRQMAKLTLHLSSSKGAIAQRVLTEVAQARSVLTGEGKAQYDTLLRARLGPGVAPPPTADSASWEVEMEQRRRESAVNRAAGRKSGVGAMFMGAALAILLVGGTAFVLSRRDAPPVVANAVRDEKGIESKKVAEPSRGLPSLPQPLKEKPATVSMEKEETPLKPEPVPEIKPEESKPTPTETRTEPNPAPESNRKKPETSAKEQTPTPEPEPAKAMTSAEPVVLLATPEQEAELKRAISRAISMEGRRNFSGADDNIDLAIIHAASPELSERARDAELLVQYHRDFWSAVRQQIARMKPGETLSIGEDDEVALVESKDDSLTVRASGRNRVYAVEEAPAKLVFAFASAWLDKNDAKSKVVLGAFHALDPRGDRETARRLWNEAVEQGVDAKFLLTFLDEAGS